MAGGLIQIASYGSQDLYLTGTPEITFFKVVYRRHTNFSIESVPITFDDPVGFGKTSALTVSRVGDLIHKTYLQIILPEIDLQRLFTSNTLIGEVQNAESNFLITENFMQVNRTAFVAAYDIFIAENTASSTSMINAVNSVFANPANSGAIIAFQDLMAVTATPFSYDEVSMKSVADSFGPSDSKAVVFNALSVALQKSIKTQNFFFIELRTLQEGLAEEMNPNIKFAWVQRVGHAIIQQIEVKIGGFTIDRQYGDWINIWYELSANRSMENVYFKMIGNVPVLTDFNRNVKPSYILRIPLDFWFCRFSGLAVPLVALEYHDVTFEVIFRNIQDVAYVGTGERIKSNPTDTEGLLLEEVPVQLGIEIHATMLIDYIYLDVTERKRFAQASHEYLIEQLQVLEITNVTKQQLQILLTNFVYPVKEMIWVAQQVQYTQNNLGYTQLRWDDYSTGPNGFGNIVVSSEIDFHSYVRVPKLDGNYYNYVQPYETHNTIPSDGVNMYSFSAFPEEFQPSGAANMTRIVRILLSLQFSPRLIQDGVMQPLNVRVYARNLNILRISNGLGGVIYTYG